MLIHCEIFFADFNRITSCNPSFVCTESVLNVIERMNWLTSLFRSTDNSALTNLCVILRVPVQLIVLSLLSWCAAFITCCAFKNSRQTWSPNRVFMVALVAMAVPSHVHICVCSLASVWRRFNLYMSSGILILYFMIENERILLILDRYLRMSEWYKAVF